MLIMNKQGVSRVRTKQKHEEWRRNAKKEQGSLRRRLARRLSMPVGLS